LNIIMAIGLWLAGYLCKWPVIGRNETASIVNED